VYHACARICEWVWVSVLGCPIRGHMTMTVCACIVAVAMTPVFIAVLSVYLSL